MNRDDFQVVTACVDASRGIISSNRKDDLLARIRADARALWALRVLDAAEETGVVFEQPAYGSVSRRWWIRSVDYPTADAARFAAAKAVFTRLDEKAKAIVGNCP